ncbi:MFS quinate transporter QutD [Aureobasidium subglaciale]|nr:MFS quinate transporter QutD [Aureobasidium subglaciale]KAI5215113.1 MFS quinate transporter QutD [Aureobasidium subglaciale]KAI5218285.1 MFS quinate transporter QutD [Aureobasidium subglaciale]KAI5256025.1 MFS quinate transporter QutD [Aureobasidium subglaciale]
MRNRVILVFCAFALQNLSGASAINYYLPTLFRSLRVSDIPLYIGVYRLVKAIASIIYYIFFINMLSRRSPVLVTSVFIRAYVKVGHPADAITASVPVSASTAAGGRAAIGIIIIYSIFWSFGLNGIPCIVSAEIFPGSLRVFTGAYAALCQWLVYIDAGSDDLDIFLIPKTKGLTID